MMDPHAASTEMMQKLWTDWFTMLGHAQSRAASAMKAAAQPPDAAEVEDGGERATVYGPAAYLTPEVMLQFQDAFLRAMSDHCEKYMRSPEFLALMKRSMDGALAFREQINEVLGKAMAAGAQAPGGLAPDQTVIVDAIRETERTLRDQIEALSIRLSGLEARLDGTRASEKRDDPGSTGS